MRVMTLGAVLGAGETPHLPSSESVLSAINGEPGGWGKVLASTLLRALLVAPGVWFAGGRGARLVGGSLVASTSITAFLFLWYLAHRGGTEATPLPAPVEASGPALPEVSEGVSVVDGVGQLRVARRRR